MKLYEDREDNPLVIKAVVIVVVVLFAIIGLIGLILPIIPGILFLGLAALLLSKVSSRFSDYLDENLLWQKLRRNVDSARLLSWGEKVRIGLLWTLRELVTGIERLLNAISRDRRK